MINSQVFSRYETENYGESTVELVEINLDNSFASVNVDGKDIFFPILSIKDKYPECHGYAIVERLKSYPITKIDILYTYKDIMYLFNNNESYRRKLLKLLNRFRIDLEGTKTFGVIIPPESIDEKTRFLNAERDAIRNAKMAVAHVLSEEDIEEEIEPNPEDVDGIVVTLIKDIYEAFTGENVPRPTDKKIKIVKRTLEKKGLFFKNGSVIINGVETSKYLTFFQTDLSTQPNILQDGLAIYVTDINDYNLYNDPQYAKKVGNAILDSNILETFTLLNPQKLPKWNYAGTYDDTEGRLKVREDIERQFDLINKLLFDTKDKSR